MNNESCLLFFSPEVPALTVDVTRRSERVPWPAWWATCLWPHWALWTAADGGNSWGRPRRRWPCWPRWRGPPWSRWGAAARCAARSGCCTASRRCFWSGCSFLCDTWGSLLKLSGVSPNGENDRHRSSRLAGFSQQHVTLFLLERNAECSTLAAS